MAFQKAVKEKLSSKIAIEGPAGSGKTYSALLLAHGMGGKIALLDTENRSSCLYANKEHEPGFKFEFDVEHVKAPYEPEKYIRVIKDAEHNGYRTLVIDSASHEWEGVGGILEISSKMQGNSFTNWAKLTPRHNAFINAILQSPLNIISCFRTKVAYEIVENDKGKAIPKKLGMKPITREGFDYENTIVFTLNMSNIAEATKDRTGLYIGRQKVLLAEDGQKIQEFLNDGETREEKGRAFLWATFQKHVNMEKLGERANTCYVAMLSYLANNPEVKKVEDLNIAEIEIIAKTLTATPGVIASYEASWTEAQALAAGENTANTLPFNT